MEANINSIFSVIKEYQITIIIIISILIPIWLYNYIQEKRGI